MARLRRLIAVVSVPLRGVGCFADNSEKSRRRELFPSPCGVWVVSRSRTTCRSSSAEFPSPCGVWVVSPAKQNERNKRKCFRPLAGCGLFRVCSGPLQVICVVSVPLRGVGCFLCTKMRAPKGAVSVPLRGVGCFGKAAHSFWCNRKKNCLLCYFIVSYWQMFINSKLRNCKVPCEAHKTAT